MPPGIVWLKLAPEMTVESASGGTARIADGPPSANVLPAAARATNVSEATASTSDFETLDGMATPS